MATVDEILQYPFRLLSRQKQERILQQDKPRPPLRHLRSMDVNSTSNGQKTVVITIFDVSTYDQVEWMTGCERRQALFCWPCLLFSAQSNPWNLKGVTTLSCLKETIRTHEKLYCHIKAMFDWRISKRKRNFDVSVDCIDQNEMINRNREIIKRIIDVVCSLIMQQPPSRNGSNVKNQLKLEDCLEFMTLLREYDALQCSIIDDALDVMQITPAIINDIVDCITSILKSSIQKEMQLSPYVSIILSEHSEDVTRSQISTVLRYFKDGKVCERFVGFTNLERQKSDFKTLPFLSKVANSYEVASRLFGIALDGSTLKCNKFIMQEFQKALPSAFPHSFFVPCYFHKMENVLQQSVRIYKDVDCFFKHLEIMASYFIKESMIRRNFEAFENGLLMDMESFETMKYPEVFMCVKAGRETFLSFFDSVLKNPEEWNGSHLTQVMCFREFLMSFNTIFLLEVFIKLYGVIQNFCYTLKSETPEDAFHSHIISDILKSLQNIKYNDFDKLWESCFESYDMHQLKKLHQENGKWVNRANNRALFLDIVRCFQLQFSNRFELPLPLEFFHILNYDTHTNGKLKDYTQKLFARGASFDHTELDTEIDTLKTVKPGNFSVYELMQYFTEKKLRPSFGNLYKLSELILSLPCKPPSMGGGPTKLDEITPWTYTSREEFTGDTSVLCVEREYLQELRKGISFYDDVIARFILINQTMELEYQVKII